MLQPMKELRALTRKIEDIQELRIQTKTERAIVTADLNRLKEMERNEINHKEKLKQLLQQITEQIDKETQHFERNKRIQFNLKNGSIRELVGLCEGHLNQLKESSKIKKKKMEENLKAHIDDLTRSRPLVAEYHKKLDEYDQLVRQKENLSKEEKAFKAKADEEELFAYLMFQQNVIEMAQQVLRYNHIRESLNNPKKKTAMAIRRNVMTFPMKRIPTPEKPVASVPDFDPNSRSNEILPETPSTSKCQKAIDTNETVDDSVLISRSSVSHYEMKSKKSSDENQNQRVVSKKPEENQKKLEESKSRRPTPPGDDRGKRFDAKKSEENKRKHEESFTIEAPKKQKVSNAESIVAKNARNQNKVKDVPKQSEPFVLRSSLRKEAYEATDSSQSQKTKKAKVTFAKNTNVGPTSSRFDSDVNSSEDNESASADFKLGAADDLDLEMPSENENEDKGNNGDETHNDGDDLNDGNDLNDGDDLNDCDDLNDGEIDGGMEFADNISDWSSLQLPGIDGERHTSSTSKARSFDIGSPSKDFNLNADFDSMMNMFSPSNGNDPQQTSNDNFSLNFSDEESRAFFD